MTHPAENPHNYHRRRPVLEGPTVRDLVVADIALHPGATTPEIAERIGSTVGAVTLAANRARMAGQVRREGVPKGYQYALPGVPFAVRPIAGMRPVDHRKEDAAEELDLLAAYIARRHPSHVAHADVAVAMHWSDSRAKSRIAALVADGRLVPAYRGDKRTGRYKLPEVPRVVVPVADNDEGGAVGFGDCDGSG